jgi:hypothetical protein
MANSVADPKLEHPLNHHLSQDCQLLEDHNLGIGVVSTANSEDEDEDDDCYFRNIPGV